nr:uncharacterized protein LOC109182027 isoform X2 [Ipomoea batatas]
MSLKTQMVAKMMKWRPWPPLISKKLEVRQVVRRLENLCGGDDSLSCGATVKKDISNYDRMIPYAINGGDSIHALTSATSGGKLAFVLARAAVVSIVAQVHAFVVAASGVLPFHYVADLVVVLAVIRRSRILLLRQETAHSSRRRHNCRHRVPFDDDGATVDIRDGNDDDIEVCMNMMETTAATASSAADATRNDGSHRSFSLRGPTVLSTLMFTAICITCGKTPPPPLSGGDSLPELTPADPVSYVSRLSSRREVMPFPALQELTLQAAFLAISQRSSSTKSCWLPPVSFPSSSPSDESAIEFTLLGWTLLL